MENLDIQNLWKQSETLLEANRKLNLTILKEMKLDKAKSSLNGLLFLPISTLLFFTLAASYAIYFIVVNYSFWYFAFAGLVVVFFSIWFIISSIKQLKLILSIDYKNNVLKIQKDVSKIKFAIVRNLRIAAWLLPFGPFITLFLFKTLLNLDLMEILDYKMIVSFGVTTVILEVISLLILKVLSPKNINKKWLNWLLMGNGRQVNEAISFIENIKKFEEKTK